MMKLKKLLSLALALGLASSLAACSSQGHLRRFPHARRQ